MSPSTKVKATAIAGAIVGSVLQILTAVGLDPRLPDGGEAYIVTAVVAVVAYFWPENNPAPSATEALRELGWRPPGG